MNPRSEREVLIEYALRDEENLAIALKIVAAHYDLCGTVIIQTMEVVKHELAMRLGEKWDIAICRDLQELAGRWAIFLTATYRDHPLQPHIALGGEENGYPKSAWLGVRLKAGSNEVTEKLKQVIDEQHSKGRGGAFSLWYRMLDKAFLLWGGEETTVLLYRKTQVVEYLVRTIGPLADVIQNALISEHSPSSTGEVGK